MIPFGTKVQYITHACSILLRTEGAFIGALGAKTAERGAPRQTSNEKWSESLAAWNDLEQCTQNMGIGGPTIKVFASPS